MSPDPPSGRVDPDSVARAGFGSARRGFDQNQVRSYLRLVSREIERLRASEAELMRRGDDAERHVTEQSPTDPAPLTQCLGEETARVPHAARERVLLAYEAVRRSLDEAERELAIALPNARSAADATARRLEAEPELTVGQLEEEIALARVANLPLLAPESDDERRDDDDP